VTEQKRALTTKLMEEVLSRENLNQAYLRVKANNGAPGIDGMTIQEMYGWLSENKSTLIQKLLEGDYKRKRSINPIL
jgi:RNA-directed DNA polymerase